MPKTKRIVCPHCRTAHKIGEGYHFNESLSLICNSCDKVIFPANEKDETGIPKAADRRYTANRGSFNQHGWDEDINFA
jgi:RNase P subunit RPR2